MTPAVSLDPKITDFAGTNPTFTQLLCRLNQLLTGGTECTLAVFHLSQFPGVRQTVACTRLVAAAWTQRKLVLIIASRREVVAQFALARQSHGIPFRLHTETLLSFSSPGGVRRSALYRCSGSVIGMIPPRNGSSGRSRKKPRVSIRFKTKVAAASLVHDNRRVRANARFDNNRTARSSTSFASSLPPSRQSPPRSSSPQNVGLRAARHMQARDVRDRP